MLEDVSEVAFAIISCDKTQYNRVCCFQSLDAVIPKGPPFQINCNMLRYVLGSKSICILCGAGLKCRRPKKAGILTRRHKQSSISKGACMIK